MKWLITEDNVSEGINNYSLRKGTLNKINLSGILTDQLPIRFRLKDDDGIVYFEGRCNNLNGSEEEVFEPLNWAMIDLGCTSMEYMDEHYKWVVL